MNRDRTLGMLLVLFAACSLVHFAHNAEFLAEYPNLPASWSRADVYAAWLGMTAVGIAGWIVAKWRRVPGLLILVVYALLGLDSLGHYVLAPLSAHSAGMNATILLEVTAAALVLVEVARQAVAQLRKAQERT